MEHIGGSLIWQEVYRSLKKLGNLCYIANNYILKCEHAAAHCKVHCQIQWSHTKLIKWPFAVCASKIHKKYKAKKVLILYTIHIYIHIYSRNALQVQEQNTNSPISALWFTLWNFIWYGSHGSSGRNDIR